MNSGNFDNPYSAESNPYAGGAYGQGMQPPVGEPMNPSILTQIRVIAILLVVHGVILTLTSGLYFGLAVFLPDAIAQQQMKQQPPGGPTPQQMSMILTATYGVMGFAALIPGLLQLFAGVRNLYLKGRIFGLVSLFSGVIAVLSCYCAPTSIALMIYGLIIYFHPTATRAFELGSKGVKLNEMFGDKYNNM